jgi:hypothetical protein
MSTSSNVIETNRNWNELGDMHYVSNNPAYMSVKGSVGDPKPTIDTPSSAATVTPTANKRIGFNRSYFLSIRGLLRVLLIVCLTSVLFLQTNSFYFSF